MVVLSFAFFRKVLSNIYNVSNFSCNIETTGLILCSLSKAGSFTAGRGTFGSQKCKYLFNCLNLSLVKIVGIPGICKYHFRVLGCKITLKSRNYDHIIHDDQNDKKGSNFVPIRVSPLHSMFLRVQSFLLGIVVVCPLY